MSQAVRQLQEREVPRRSYQPRPETTELPKRKVTKGEKGLWVLGGLIVLILAIFIVSNQAKIFTTSRDISDLQKKADNQSKVNQQLGVQVTELGAPERIIEYAKDKLGLKLDIKNVKILP